MSTVPARLPSQQMLLPGIDWTTYSRLLRAFSGDLQGFLALRGQQDENTIVRQFRTWVQQR